MNRLTLLYLNISTYTDINNNIKPLYFLPKTCRLVLFKPYILNLILKKIKVQ